MVCQFILSLCVSLLCLSAAAAEQLLSAVMLIRILIMKLRYRLLGRNFVPLHGGEIFGSLVVLVEEHCFSYAPRVVPLNFLLLRAVVHVFVKIQFTVVTPPF